MIKLLLVVFLVIPFHAFADGDLHIANSGAAFILDASNQKLSPAYRDQAGRVWGSGSKSVVKNQYEAADFCKRLGARLPSVDDFNDLAKQLGNNSGPGYSPLSDDYVTPVLPNFISGNYWASDVSKYNGIGYEFSATDGYIGVTSSGNANPVICISL